VNRRSNVDQLPGNHSSEHCGHAHIKQGANKKRDDNADGQIALRIPGLLRGGRNSIEANVCKENVPGRSSNPGKSEGSEAMPVMTPVAGMDVARAQGQDKQNNGHLHHYNAGIELRAFLDPYDQNRRKLQEQSRRPAD